MHFNQVYNEMENSSDEDQQEVKGQRNVNIIEKFTIENSPDMHYRYSVHNLPLLFALCGILSIFLAILGLWYGVTSFEDDHVTQKNPHNRYSVYIETNFGLILLLYSGGDVICKFFTGKYSKRHPILLAVLFLALAQTFCGSTSQLANLEWSKVESDVTKSMVLIILNVVASGAIVCQICLAVRINETEYSTLQSSLHFERNNPRVLGKNDSKVFAMLTSLCQITMGVSLGFLIVKSESRFEKSIKFSDEIGVTPWLVATSGLATAWSSVYMKENVNKLSLLLCSIVLQGFCVFMTSKFILIPFEILYIFSNNQNVPKFDPNLYGCQILMAIAVFLCSLAVFCSLIRDYCKVSAKSSNIDRSLQRGGLADTGFIKRAWLAQLVMLVCFVILLIFGFWNRYLFASDFTPLPLLMLAHTVTSFALYKRVHDAPWYLANFASVTACALFSFRDVYMFNYHVAKHGETPDSYREMLMRENQYSNDTKMIGEILESKTTVNIGLVMLGLLELLFCLSCCATYLRVALDHFLFVYNKHQFATLPLKLSLLAMCQAGCAFVSLYLGFTTFLANDFTAEMFGDHCLYISVLAIFCSILSFCAAKFPDFLPFALIGQIFVVFLSLHFLDFGAFSLRIVLQQSRQESFRVLPNRFGRLPNMNAIKFTQISFALMFFQIVLTVCQIVLIFNPVELGEYAPKPDILAISANIFAH